MRSISGWSQSAMDTRPACFACARASRARCKNAVGRKSPNRQVVVAGPAEAAEIGAAADDLDEEARPELCIGRENPGAGRIERLCRGHGSFPHRGRCAGGFLGHETLDRAIRLVFDVVERRDVEASLLRERLQQIAPPSVFSERAQQRGNQLLSFAGRNHVGEHREGFRVDEGDRAADDDERVAGGAIRPIAPARRPAGASSECSCSPIRTTRRTR